MNIFFDKCSDASEYASNTKTFGIFYSKENNPNSNIHTHECFEILLCLKGGKNFLIDDKVYKVHPNDIFVLNCFEAHKITFEDDCDVERYTIQIHPEFIFSASTDKTDLSACFYHSEKNRSNCITLTDSDSKYICDIFNSLKEEKSFGDDILKKALMIQLLAFVNERFLTNHTEVTDQPQNIQLKNAILYINEHLAENLTLEDIAKNSYISVNQLCRIFKSNLGTTVMKYIVGKRISQAKKYLKKSYSVSDTAFMCGFCDYSNFIRTFTKSVGISPGKYKNQGL